MCLAADHNADALVHALVHDMPDNELALMEMPCSCCIGHDSGLLQQAATVQKWVVLVLFLVCHYEIPM
jgi:hypothetical protein